jgi:hypothetical protein
VAQHLLLPPIPRFEPTHRYLESTIIFQNAHPLKEWRHEDVAQGYFITKEIGSFVVDHALGQVFQEFDLAFLLELEFLVEEHAVEAPFEGGFEEELEEEICVGVGGVGVEAWEELGGFVEDLVEVLDAVSFSTEDFIAMFNSRNLSLVRFNLLIFLIQNLHSLIL